jgi:hypothetical protein
MPATDYWLDQFGKRHDATSYPALYRVSLLLLQIGVVALLWSLPVPVELQKISPLLNWGSMFLMASLVYYFIMSVALGLGMIPFVFGIAALQAWLAALPVTVPYVASTLIGCGVAGLVFGRLTHGGARAVLQDVQLMMIAPVWLLSVLYRRAGIPY